VTLVALVGGGVVPPLGMVVDDIFTPLACVQVAVRLVTTYALVWMMASLVANRYRRSEEALRLAVEARERLRAQIAPGPRVGTRSGRTLAGLYDLHELLGAGGMGEVYAGVRLTDGRAVAVKVLHDQHMADPRMRERFRREAELVARLPARHVAELYAHAEHDGVQFLVMELLRGEDLAACFKRRGVLPPAELLALVELLAHALDAAHALGIVHRDLKPQNVFLVEGGGVRLLDFGIARLFDGDDHPLTQVAVLGTPGFLSPEQARGERGRIGPATDVFALATLTYRGLTGRHAFPARELRAAVHEALFHQPEPPSRLVAGLAADVDDVFRLALARAPEDRQTSAGDFVRELREALAGQLPAARRGKARDLLADQQRITITETGDAALAR
jgi:serine/threonine-protein kinase